MNTVIEKNHQWIDETWEKINEKLCVVAQRSYDKLPYTSQNGVHISRVENPNDVNWWTNGFWGGMMWLMYVATGNEVYRKTAERSCRISD